VGLAGIYPRSGRVIRPLLLATRDEVERFLRQRELAWCEDASNRDVAIPRNRIRHELMPWLRQHFGAGVDAVMARQADVFREDAERLDAEATEIGRDLVLETNGRTDVPLIGLLALPSAMGRRVVLAVLRRRAGGRFVGFQHVEAVLATAVGAETRAALDLPGQRLERRGDLLSFQTVEADSGRRGQRRGRAAGMREPVSKKSGARAGAAGRSDGA
jgi:tRNA(Ile)-lysidine synthase